MKDREQQTGERLELRGAQRGPRDQEMEPKAEGRAGTETQLHFLTRCLPSTEVPPTARDPTHVTGAPCSSPTTPPPLHKVQVWSDCIASHEVCCWSARRWGRVATAEPPPQTLAMPLALREWWASSCFPRACCLAGKYFYLPCGLQAGVSPLEPQASNPQ